MDSLDNVCVALVSTAKDWGSSITGKTQGFLLVKKLTILILFSLMFDVAYTLMCPFCKQRSDVAQRNAMSEKVNGWNRELILRIISKIYTSISEQLLQNKVDS